jgi:hypothetical protein
VATRKTEAVRLLAAVEAEALRPLELRRTRASDADLVTIKRLLAAAMDDEATASPGALRGRISHVVADTWSFDAALSDELVAFDDRFIAAG